MEVINFAVIARVLIGFTFFFAGLANLYYREIKINVIKGRLPYPTIVFHIGVITQTIAGAAVMLNFEVIYALYALIIFTILANIIFHDFWNTSGDTLRVKLQNFNTSLAILGGLILLLAITI